MATQIQHASFTVGDVDRSVDFYQKALGLSFKDKQGRDPDFAARVTGIPGANIVCAYLTTGNCDLELVQYLSPAGDKIDTRTCNVGSAHVALIVDDFNDTMQKVLAMGGRLAGEVSTIPAGPNKGRSIAYMEDPDGNTLEVLG